MKKISVTYLGFSLKTNLNEITEPIARLFSEKTDELCPVDYEEIDFLAPRADAEIPTIELTISMSVFEEPFKYSHVQNMAIAHLGDRLNQIAADHLAANPEQYSGKPRSTVRIYLISSIYDKSRPNA